MTINYLILAHQNYEHITRLIGSLDAPGASFFVHIDQRRRENYSNEAGNVFVIRDRVKVNWGCYSMVEATLRLIKTAVNKRPADYYILLSGADYPIRSNEDIRRVLSARREFIHMKPVPYPRKPMSRFRYYFIEYNKKIKNLSWIFFRSVEAMMRVLGIRRKVPFRVFAGSQWWALTGECINYILETIESDSRYIRFFKHSLIPDEAFFHTIIGNSPFMEKVANTLTFTHWTEKYSPQLINEEHLELFREMSHNHMGDPKVFARKFDKSNRHLPEAIDRELR
jgi:hypothetical protein